MKRRSVSPASSLSKDDLESTLRAALKEAVGEIVGRVRTSVREELRDALSNSPIQTDQLDGPDAGIPAQWCGSSANSAGWLSGTLVSSAPHAERSVRVSMDLDKELEAMSNVSDGRPAYSAIIDQSLSPPGSSGRESIRLSAGLKADRSSKTAQYLEFHMIEEIDEDGDPTPLERLVHSSWFEYLAGLLVVLNAVALGFETQVQCLTHGHPSMSWKMTIEVEEAIFCTLFFFELILRMYVFGWSFFTNPSWAWNCFDFMIVSMQVMEQLFILFSRGGTHLAAFSVLRILRLFRVLRMVRLLHLLESLKILVTSIVSAVTAIMWAIVLMIIMIYGFSILFTEMVIAVDSELNNEKLRYWFGDIPRTALTLFECFMGGVSWDEPAVALFDHVGALSGVCLCFYVCMGLFILLNVVTGVFIDRTMKITTQEEDRKIALDINRTFTDHGLSMDVTWPDFKTKLGDPPMQKFFELLNTDVSDAEKLFELIDVDGSGTVDADEIVGACMRLKGTARAFDVALMMQKLTTVSDKLDDHIEHIGDHLDQLIGRMRFLSEGPMSGAQSAERSDSRKSSILKTSTMSQNCTSALRPGRRSGRASVTLKGDGTKESNRFCL